MKIGYPDNKTEGIDLKFNQYGRYLVGDNNTWHGGIHIEGINESIHAIADGRIIAYRFESKNKQSKDKGGNVLFEYSNNFVLIQHDLELEKEIIRNKGTKKETIEIKKKLVTFYTLYNHLKSVSELESLSEKDKEVKGKFIPNFAKKHQVKVIKEEGFEGIKEKRVGLNCRRKVPGRPINKGKKVIVIPKGATVSKQFEKNGEEKKIGSWACISFTDIDGKQYDNVYICTADKKTYKNKKLIKSEVRVSELPDSYKIVIEENSETWINTSNLSKEQKESKKGARVRKNKADTEIVSIIPFKEEVKIKNREDKNWWLLEGYEGGFSHRNNFSEKIIFDTKKMTTNNEVKACDIPIKAGDIVGYTGKCGSVLNPSYSAAHVELFMAEGAEDFIKNTFDAGKESDKKYFLLRAGTKLKQWLRVDNTCLEEGSRVKVLERKGKYVKVKVLKPNPVERVLDAKTLKDYSSSAQGKLEYHKRKGNVKSYYTFKNEAAFKEINTIFNNILPDSSVKLYWEYRCDKNGVKLKGNWKQRKNKEKELIGKGKKSYRKLKYIPDFESIEKDIWIKYEHLDDTVEYEMVKHYRKKLVSVTEEKSYVDFVHKVSYAEKEVVEESFALKPIDTTETKKGNKKEQADIDTIEDDALERKHESDFQDINNLKLRRIEEPSQDKLIRVVPREYLPDSHYYKSKKGGYFTIQPEYFTEINAYFDNKLIDGTAKLYLDGYVTEGGDISKTKAQKSDPKYRKLVYEWQNHYNEVAVYTTKEETGKTHRPEEGEVVPLISAANEVYMVIGSGKEGEEKIVRKNAIIETNGKRINLHEKSFNYLHVTCTHTLGYETETQEGWIDANLVSKDKLFSAYDLRRFNFRYSDAGSEYMYDIKGLRGSKTTEGSLMRALVDLFDRDNDYKLDLTELNLAYRVRESQEMVSKMVCKHKNEWSYKPVEIKEEVATFFDSQIDDYQKLYKEDFDIKELDQEKSEKLQGLEIQIKDLMFWEEAKKASYDAPKTKEAKKREEAEKEAPRGMSTLIYENPQTQTLKAYYLCDEEDMLRDKNGNVDLIAPLKSEVLTQEKERKKQKELIIPRKFPSTDMVYHFHPIAFVNHMKLIFGEGGSQNVCYAELRVRAFMRMLRVGEGTEGEQGYTKAFGGNKIDDLSTHPKKNYGGSTAAGAYQIMRYTYAWLGGSKLEWTGEYFKILDEYEKWHDYIKKYQILDFQPESQDKLCLCLMKNKKGMIQDIIDGNIKNAILEYGSSIWASLPNKKGNSNYDFKGRPQPNTSMINCLADFSKYYKEELKGISDLHLKPGFLNEFGYKSCNNTFSSPPWMEIAFSEAIAAGFVKESISPTNDLAKKYHTHVGKKNASGSTAWCSSFVSWCLDQTEYKGSKSAASQSVLWQEGKLFKRIEEPVYGCIVLLTNYVVSNGRQTSNGHVTFLAGKDSNGDLICLGGNQGNTLKYSMYYNSKTKGRKFEQDQNEGKDTLVEQRLNGFFLPINYPEPSNKELKLLNATTLNMSLGKKNNKPQNKNESTI